MKLILASLMLTSSFAFAAPCENFAKFFAIRDYKARAGSIPGSFGVESGATFQGELKGAYLYKVEIVDNNEDGDVWTINYDVLVKPIGTTKKCELVSLNTNDL